MSYIFEENMDKNQNIKKNGTKEEINETNCRKMEHKLIENG